MSTQRKALHALLRAAAFAGVALACAAGSPARAHAQSVERIFSSGNEAYFRGDIAAATRQYHVLVDAGVHDPDVYFNLALAEARLGHLGQTVLFLERSLWLRPGDETVEQELAAARNALGGKRAERDGEATMQARPPLIEALVRPFSANALAGLVFGLDVLMFALLLLRKSTRREPLRFGLAVAVPLIALLLLAAGIGLSVKSDVLRNGAAAIVLREGAELREGPDGAAQVRQSAHEGDSARLSRHESGFAHVQLSSGARGWIRDKDVGAVRPD